MPLYFFNIRNGDDVVDRDGTEYADNEAARTAAILFAADTLKDRAGTFWDEGQWSLDVADERGLTLFSLIVAGVTAPAGK